MKNRYFFTGYVEDPKTGNIKEFYYRQLNADNSTASAVEGMMYETKGGRIIETDAMYPFEIRQKITCHDGRKMIISQVQYITRTNNTPASRYTAPVRVAVIMLE